MEHKEKINGLQNQGDPSVLYGSTYGVQSPLGGATKVNHHLR